MTSKLSAVVITLNEERNIGRCIKALKEIADEIIVLDAFSTDKTVSICENLGARVEQREWEGYSESKNYLNSLASFGYIFSIDADEVVNEELKNAILSEKEKGFKGVYSVNRLTNYMGAWIKHSGWYPDVKTRIFPKEGSQWEGAFVHETLSVPKGSETKLLDGHLEHYSYYSFEDHRTRADKYSLLTARKHFDAGKKASFFKPYLSAIGRFVGMYFFKQGFLDGKMGFHIARISALSNIVKYKELRRLNRE
jgi:glycosyltransferase involved in cell wall biosynthesis|tara:strand:- start:8616 stop:9371 length:756 start_codon:yes stop_codon:yes gene_type:complete